MTAPDHATGGQAMPPVPAEQPQAPQHTETVEARFRRLEAVWEEETGHLSATTRTVGHPAFREIVALGEAVVPLMLRDLQKRPRLWVWALPEITGADPVSVPDRGNIARMTDAWLRWGREHGYQG
jgi:hypothetical protein